MGVVLLASCQKATTLERPFNLYQVGTLTATAGDNEATLTWTTLDGKPNPELFIVTWTPDAAGVEGGKQELSGDKRELVVKDLVNDCGYTFGVQAKYASGLAQKITAKCTPKTSRFAVTGFSANAGSEEYCSGRRNPKQTVFPATPLPGLLAMAPRNSPTLRLSSTW